MTTAKSKRPQAGTLLMFLGAFYVVFAGFALLMSRFQLWMQQYIPQDQAIDQGRFALRMHQVWRDHLPWMMGLGCVYLLFGWRLAKLARAKFVLSWILIALSLAVAISYVVHILPISKAFSQSMPMAAFRNFSYASSVFGAVICLVMAVAPQLGILWLMKREEC